MKLITRWTMAADQARMARDEVKRFLRSGVNPPEAHVRALADLGEKPNPDDVDRIIGSPTTLIQCDECFERVGEVVGFHADGEGDALCAKCLLKAMQLINP